VSVNSGGWRLRALRTAPGITCNSPSCLCSSLPSSQRTQVVVTGNDPSRQSITVPTRRVCRFPQAHPKKKGRQLAQRRPCRCSRSAPLDHVLAFRLVLAACRAVLTVGSFIAGQVVKASAVVRRCVAGVLDPLQDTPEGRLALAGLLLPLGNLLAPGPVFGVDLPGGFLLLLRDGGLVQLPASSRPLLSVRSQPETHFALAPDRPPE
jgi:hypothetical protein